MRYAKIGLAVVGVVWVAVVAAALFWNLAPSDNFFGMTTNASATVGGHSPGSLGKSRHRALVEATQRYTRAATDVSPGIAAGTEFAPVPFLNKELERQGANWRVRSAKGVQAVIYEIS